MRKIFRLLTPQSGCSGRHTTDSYGFRLLPCLVTKGCNRNTHFFCCIRAGTNLANVHYSLVFENVRKCLWMKSVKRRKKDQEVDLIPNRLRQTLTCTGFDSFLSDRLPKQVVLVQPRAFSFHYNRLGSIASPSVSHLWDCVGIWKEEEGRPMGGKLIHFSKIHMKSHLLHCV